ncbi:MAG: hypothetical protein JNL11_12140 [Bdellovibrionaceae bacterium]|nr:hypothetical protein [Pseudobdellovibrionaceae bacterium]
MAATKNTSDVSKSPRQSGRGDNSSRVSEKESLSHKAGDKLERAGEKLRKAGAESLGEAVYKAGNKLEHWQDRKKSSH